MSWMVLCLMAQLIAGEENAVDGVNRLERANTLGPHGAFGVGCWFWTAEEFEPDGYKRFLDLHARHAAFDLLTTSIRHPVEVTDSAVHDQIAAAVEYAQARGMGIVLDLDVRLARSAFQERYPDEMQEIVRLREAPLSADSDFLMRVESVSFGDHYTFRARPYDCISSRLLRAYSYMRSAEGIDANSVVDITDRCRVKSATTEEMIVTIPAQAEDGGRTACIMAAFTLFTPSVFAPHLAEFEHEVMRGYSDIPLAGACKDEWGFPGRFEPATDELWFCPSMAKAYAERRPGRDLIFDFLLMSQGMHGQAGARIAAINHWMEMLREQNVHIEERFYSSVKEVFGVDAFVGTHPTWYPYPGVQEAFKNGLSWWAAHRDIAQTDETTPYCVRTALAKKWRSPIWLNMYYAPDLESYSDDVWRHALGGGRMNFHPLWPASFDALSESLLDSDALDADARIRLLSFVSTAPIDCPVAIVFGHPAFSNWAGPGFADAGVALADALWERGIYADLIPTSEINSRALHVSDDGSLAYGLQRYAAAVLYHPDFERPETAEFWRNVADRGQTQLFRIGEWSTEFEGKPVDGAALLPSSMRATELADCVEAIERALAARGIALQAPCESRTLHNFPASMTPRRSGVCRLIDGTVIHVSGERSAAGDPIQTTLTVRGASIEVDAIGLVAVRVDSRGQVEALACGGLKRFKGGGIDIELDDRVDIALWRERDGAWKCASLGLESPIAPSLDAITSDWIRLRTPLPRPAK